MASSFRYHVGGCLQLDAPNYVERQADLDLYQALQSRDFCYIFSARQMGKSSLLVRVKARLQNEGARCAYLDMTRLGSDGLTQAQWYGGLVMSLLQSLNLWRQVNFTQWWQERQGLPLVQRLNQLVEEVLIKDVEGSPIYIFIDEIDSLLSLDFSTDDFFAWMRSCYNQRAHDPRYHRLTFALFGVATPSDLIADKQRTPFNIGLAIPLTGFTVAEAAPLQPGLDPWVEYPERVLQHILAWTGGQPFLTQKLCDLAVQTAAQAGSMPLKLSPGMAEVWVDGIVRSRILNHWESQDEPIHLRTIRDHLFWYKNRTARLLGVYQQLLDGETVYADDSREQIDLLLSGLVVRRDNQLAIKNRIYQQVFTPEWVYRQLKRLRPYANALEAWLASGRQDTACLLHGEYLLEVEQWARDKSLTDLDYQFLAASQDAERRRIQQILDAKQESERFFRQLAEAVPQIVWIVEPDGRLSYTNQQGHDFSGLSLEALGGHQRINVVHPSDRPASLAAWETAHATGEPYEVQLRMRDADGNYRWFLNRAVPIRDAYGKVVKWFGTSTDLDDVKRSEEAKRLQEVEARLVEQDRRLEQEKRARRLQRWLSGSVSVAFLISSALGIFAWSQKHQLALREIEAIANASEAQFASGNRLDALVTAIEAQVRLNRLRHPPDRLVEQVDRDLRRAAFQVVERNRLEAGLGTVLGVALNSDGRMASAHLRGAIALWAADGTLLKTLRAHDKEVLDVAFSPDGQILVSTGKDGTVRLWTADGDPLKTLKGHQNRGMAVAISPDGRWIASASEDNTVKLWSTGGKLMQTLQGHSHFVWDAAFSPDSQTLASASWDNTIIVWNLAGQQLRTLTNPQVSDKGENRLVSVAFSPDGKTLVAGDWYGNILWWNQDGTLLHTASAHENAVINLEFSPDEQTLASASWDGSIQLWNLDGHVIKSLAGHATGTWELEFTPDGQQLISGGGDDLIRIWQLQPNHLTVLRGHRASVWGVAIAPNRHVFSSSSDGTLKHWSSQGNLLQTLEFETGDRGEVWAVAVSPDGGAIAAVSNDGSLSLWDSKGRLRRTITAHQDVSFDVTFNPDGNEIATTSWDGSVKLWDANGSLLQTLTNQQERQNAVAFSPDNQWIAAVGQDQILRLWQRSETGRFLPQPQFEGKGHTDNMFGVAFSPDSQIVATASEDTTVKIWGTDGKLLSTFTGHKSRVNAVIFIPADAGLPAEWGTVVASASWDNSVKLWSLDGTPRLTLEGHEERVLGLDFRPATNTHGPILASSGIDDVVILWPLDQVTDREQIVQDGCTWVQNYLKTRPKSSNTLKLCPLP